MSAPLGNRIRVYLSCIGILWGCSTVVRAEDPLIELRRLYGDVRVHAVHGRPMMVFGVPMTAGETPESAAAAFLGQHGAVFRGTNLELTRRWAAKPKNSSKTIFAYRQSIRGTPVDGGDARIMVNTQAGISRVVFASGRLSGEPTSGLEEPLIPSWLAAMLVRQAVGFGPVQTTGEPEKVVLVGNATRSDAWVWRVRTLSGSGREAGPRTFLSTLPSPE
jgi:hypothetical protein